MTGCVGMRKREKKKNTASQILYPMGQRERRDMPRALRGLGLGVSFDRNEVAVGKGPGSPPALLTECGRRRQPGRPCGRTPCLQIFEPATLLCSFAAPFLPLFLHPGARALRDSVKVRLRTRFC